MYTSYDTLKKLNPRFSVDDRIYSDFGQIRCILVAKKIIKYLDLAKEQKKVIENEVVGDANCC